VRRGGDGPVDLDAVGGCFADDQIEPRERFVKRQQILIRHRAYDHRFVQRHITLTVAALGR